MNNNESLGSVALGFVLAVGNNAYGWFNTILQPHFLDSWSQALITGSIGSIGAFLTTRGLKYIEKKIKQKRDDKNNKSSVI
jgi:hypothetical protein